MSYVLPKEPRMKYHARRVIKDILFSVASSRYISARRLDAIRNAGVVTILNMHRIAPTDGSDYRPIDPEIFKETLRFLHERFELTTFGGLGSVDGDKPRAIISFDDGYKDFVEYAMPILDELGIVCNQNIIPDCVETGLPPLNVIAQDFVGKAPHELVEGLEVPGFGQRVRKTMGAEFSRFIKSRSTAEQQLLRDALLPQFFEWQEFSPAKMMSRSEVEEAAKVHEIGAHSYSHASMQFETDEFVAEDVERCRRYFYDILKIPMKIYAFPNGSFRSSQLQLVLDAGIQHVLLVGEKFDRNKKVHTRFTFDGLTKAEAKFKALGGFARVQK
ncbi:MAG: polysaccharide deacetylase family protein [Hydrogenophaga sp.]|nr:polysaccharide deacetylase family protein [Hydrogenophaga sp.]